MKPMDIALIALALLLVVSVMLYQPPPEQYVWGQMRIPVRGISAEICTAEQAPPCGCCHALWGGGMATTDADLSGVQVGDIAYLTSPDGDCMVLECVRITGMPSWLLRADGDVLVSNGRWVCRFTRL